MGIFRVCLVRFFGVEFNKLRRTIKKWLKEKLENILTPSNWMGPSPNFLQISTFSSKSTQGSNNYKIIISLALKCFLHFTIRSFTIITKKKTLLFSIQRTTDCRCQQHIFLFCDEPKGRFECSNKQTDRQTNASLLTLKVSA